MCIFRRDTRKKEVKKKENIILLLLGMAQTEMSTTLSENQNFPLCQEQFLSYISSAKKNRKLDTPENTEYGV